MSQKALDRAYKHSTQLMETSAIKYEGFCCPVGASSVKKWPKSTKNGRFWAIFTTFWKIKPAYAQQKALYRAGMLFTQHVVTTATKCDGFYCPTAANSVKNDQKRVKMAVFGRF